jgi:hypothetical protein
MAADRAADAADAAAARADEAWSPIRALSESKDDAWGLGAGETGIRGAATTDDFATVTGVLKSKVGREACTVD